VRAGTLPGREEKTHRKRWEAYGGDEWSPDDVLMNSRRVPLRHGGNFEGLEISCQSRR
jgi:hypothetical protein